MTAVTTPSAAPSGNPVDGFEGDEISLFDVGSLLLIHRWRILAWALAGALIAVLPVISDPVRWSSTASFVSEGESVDGAQGGLGRLAGQFGFALPGGAGRNSPEFYAELVTSRSILGQVIDDTINVAEDGTRRTVASLTGVEAVNTARGRELAIRTMRESVALRASKAGILSLSVTTEWPSVSVSVAERILDELNRFNLAAGQSRASEERSFVESRLATQRQQLRDAEGQLSAFLNTNRQFRNSAELTFVHDRLQRDVELRQQVVLELARASEEARIREVRNVRTITVIDPPALPLQPEPRGRARRAVLGFGAGALLGVFVAFLSAFFRARIAAGDPRARRFHALLVDTRRRLFRMPGGREPSRG